MSSPTRPASHRSGQQTVIDKLDYHPGGRPLVASHEGNGESSGRHSQDISYAGSFFEEIVEGVIANDSERMKKEVLRYTGFFWAIIQCLGAGSITAFSLYGHLFFTDLKYSQLQVNGISITAELATYLPVPIWGYLCDRYGPGIPSVIAGSFFGVGYILAAFTYMSGPSVSAGGTGWPYWVMVIAFMFVGFGTACLYLAAVTTCAKNFGRGKYKGLALALPSAAFGLSGMWLSQVGSNLLFIRRPDGSKGDVDVYRFFLFLGCLLFASGIIGYFALRVIGEEELIEAAIEELEQSGLLTESAHFSSSLAIEASQQRGYGTVAQHEPDIGDEDEDGNQHKSGEQDARRLEERKTWLLNEETRLFLGDHTMWWLTAGFFFMTGPGECYINNLGTIIGTLYPPSSSAASPQGITTATTHISILAITSTLSRILSGVLTDLLAPTSSPHQHRRGPNSLANSLASLRDVARTEPKRRLEISRVAIMIFFALLLSIGCIILASGAIQGHAERFWVVSAFVGAGYGAAFSLTPIIVSVIWGIENFGTNWGIVATVPALGATIWGLIYSAVYQWATERGQRLGESPDGDTLCHGMMCYAPTFWAMTVTVWVACGMFLWAWRGPGGWVSRGVVV
ncbi:MFS general substrate transporter [Dissoconium aciculare CBS 342.82]|uniref:Probable transporter MCH1 n=1 Tax=Dissoconium aciculare CBS 342.82 TaxID=1314786 RepID=A0A6J3M3S7_9PEZI|nr:MFS general substrate transporter [Dissoconium aciculare CBS 342.82]KAF1821577.1 MFS general substrate transporter [Dissoconium aciculare CBS 342.82]